MYNMHQLSSYISCIMNLTLLIQIESHFLYLDSKCSNLPFSLFLNPLNNKNKPRYIYDTSGQRRAQTETETNKTWKGLLATQKNYQNHATLPSPPSLLLFLTPFLLKHNTFTNTFKLCNLQHPQTYLEPCTFFFQ